jgi:hypothetical protein
LRDLDLQFAAYCVQLGEVDAAIEHRPADRADTDKVAPSDRARLILGDATGRRARLPAAKAIDHAGRCGTFASGSAGLQEPPQLRAENHSGTAAVDRLQSLSIPRTSSGVA